MIVLKNILAVFLISDFCSLLCPIYAVDLSTLPANTWVDVAPAYVGPPSGGAMAPQAWNYKGAYDPQSRRVIVFDRWIDSIRNYSIYANAVLAYDPVTNVVTALKLTNWQVVGCVPPETCGYKTIALPENTSDPTPVDRHPVGGVALAGNKVYLNGGFNGSTLFRNDGVYGHAISDTWSFDLGTNRWSSVSVESTPGNPTLGGAMEYDPANQVIVLFAPTSDGAGILIYKLNLSTNQWSMVSQTPSGPWMGAGSGIAYDSKRGRILILGKGWVFEEGNPQLWAYSVPTHTWTRLADCPLTAASAGFAYDSKNDVFVALLHDGAPIDAQGNWHSQTWVYNPNSNSWSRMTSADMVRPGIRGGQPVVYDPANNVFVFGGGYSGVGRWALFRYSPGPVVLTPCDINQSGSTDVTDVQLAVNQAIGIANCTTGDINRDGNCTVLDIQRIVNAVLGGQCVTN